MKVPDILNAGKLFSSPTREKPDVSNTSENMEFPETRDSSLLTGNKTVQNIKMPGKSSFEKLSELADSPSNRLLSAAGGAGGGIIATIGVRQATQLSYDSQKASAENWMNSSEEYLCSVQQAYDSASARLPELVKDEKPGTWCVMIDMDETLVSNVNFNNMAAATGKQESPGSQAEGDETFKQKFDDFLISIPGCTRNSSMSSDNLAPLPGAGEFCSQVKELGGKVVIVTNRPGWKREDTLKNLENNNFKYDVCVFKEGKYENDKNKNLRRKDLAEGNLEIPENSNGDIPPLKVKMLVGDSVHDLYNTEKESFSDVKDRFNEDLVILPNPLYGSWDTREVKGR
jgi:predicted secreted acid phosphatase